MKAQKVQFTETVLRDANQSLIATRLPYDKFDGILEEMDKAGYYSIECWGGATFDSCLRFLNEDPWERLRKIRKKVKNTKLQMLLRGQNLLGYRHYPDDVVKMFVKKSVENGIDIIRIFDALNDTRNIKVAVEETVKAGAIASGAISYTTSPVHTLDNFVGVASEMKEMGVSTICIKDMAGVMGPQECYDLVKALKEKVGLPVVLHTHCTTGLAFITYLKGIEAGADVIDTASSAFSGGTSQPATETLVYALRELGYDCVADADVMKKVNDFFKPIRNDYIADGTLMPLAMVTDTDALNYKVPGGMLSNLFSQLKQQNALDRLNQVLEEIPRVREDLGYPPLVTPMSQMVGVQATQNVLLGERYKSIGKEVKAYLHGEYGRAPGKVNSELVKKALGEEKPIECRFADTLKPSFEKTKKELSGTAKSDEDVLSYIAFPQVAEKFFEERRKKEENVVSYTIEAVTE
jgi:conserved carboxylase region